MRWQKDTYALRLIIVNETITDNKYINHKEVMRQLINDVRKFKRNVKNFIY